MNSKRTKLIQLLKDYRYNSILVRNFGMIFCTLVVVFAMILSLVIWRMDRNTQNQVRTMSSNNLSSASSHMDNIMNEAVQIAAKLSLDEDIMGFLLTDTSDSSVSHEETLQAKKKLEQYASVFSYIDSIYVYSSKSSYIVTDTEGGPISTFADTTWYDNFTERIYEPARMISRMKYGKYPYLVTYLLPVRLTQTQFLGGIIVNIDVNKMSEYSGEGDEVFLAYDGRGDILFSSDEQYLMQKWSRLPFTEQYDENGPETQNVKVDGESMILSVRKSEEFGWRYAALSPISKYQSYRQDMVNFAGKLIGLVVILSLLGAVITSIYSYNPVRNIVSLAKNPSAYDPDTAGAFRKDETNEIMENIIRNFYSNNELRKDLKEYLDITNKAQIAALQAQISPHFLYNTLENIRWQAIALGNGDNDVSTMILKLSELLRISLDTGHEIVTISDEVRNAKIYVDIIQQRYKDRLTVLWEIDPEVKHSQIVKVSMQPLIENAVSHGIKPKRGKGQVTVRAWREENQVYVMIEDDGIGMTQEECENLNANLDDIYALRENHIGVRNVNQRLKLLLGETSGLRVESQEGSGTQVIMHFPFREMMSLQEED